MQAYYVRVVDVIGRTMYMLPNPELNNGIDVKNFAAGTYYLQLTDKLNKKVVTKSFIVKK